MVESKRVHISRIVLVSKMGCCAETQGFELEVGERRRRRRVYIALYLRSRKKETEVAGFRIKREE